MRKHILPLLLAAALLMVPARAAEDSMDNFSRKEAYTGQFSDLPEGSVFYENVAALYEYGLSVGKGDGTFGLWDPLTVSQAVIFAGRIRSIYRTGDAETGPDAHRTEEQQAVCEPYLAYLKAEGILGDELDETLFTEATRAQMAHVLAGVLPEEAVPAINGEIIDEAYAAGLFIPDVTEETPYQQDILTLYRRGICHGSDEQGSFQPEAAISRGAAAAMLTRLVEPALRTQLVWKEIAVPDLSGVTLGGLVPAGTYIAAPMTRAELDETLRHMLSSGGSELVLEYPQTLSDEDREAIAYAALDVLKVYAEQGYNAVRVTDLSEGKVRLWFYAYGAKERTEEVRQEMLRGAIAVHDQLWGEGSITADMTELEKARVYYIWVCLNCEYDEAESDLSHIPYHLFQKGVAVCDGYTSAYNLLLKLEGIDCYAYITEDHLWTVATLDGVEYHIDTTWGDVGDKASTFYFAMDPGESLMEHGVTIPLG